MFRPCGGNLIREVIGGFRLLPKVNRGLILVQEKALALLLRLGGHFRPQCGRFRELELALF